MVINLGNIQGIDVQAAPETPRLDQFGHKDSLFDVDHKRDTCSGT